MQCQPSWEGTGQGDSPGPEHPLAQAGGARGRWGWLGGWIQGFGDGTSFQGEEADSAETHPQCPVGGGSFPGMGPLSSRQY